jgi:DNA-binding transcriptional LysR family regulator
MPDVEFRLLRYFVAVAEDLHFGRAALRLHIAQPALSQAIAKLEAQIGFPLLLRTNRRVELTDAGAVLLERSRRVLADAGEAVDAARRTHFGETGRLRVGFTESVLYGGLPAVIRDFRTKFPDVDLGLVRTDGADQLDSLVRGDVDVVIGRREGSDDRVVTRSLRWENIWLVLPPDHHLGGSATVALEAVAGEPFVFPKRSASPATYDTMLGLCRSAGFSPQIVHEVERLDLVPAYAAGGLGLGLVPEYFRAAGDGLASFHPIAEIPAWLELVVMHLADPGQSSVGAFADVAARMSSARSASFSRSATPSDWQIRGRNRDSAASPGVFGRSQPPR